MGTCRTEGQGTNIWKKQSCVFHRRAPKRNDGHFNKCLRYVHILHFFCIAVHLKWEESYSYSFWGKIKASDDLLKVVLPHPYPSFNLIHLSYLFTKYQVVQDTLDFSVSVHHFIKVTAYIMQKTNSNICIHLFIMQYFVHSDGQQAWPLSHKVTANKKRTILLGVNLTV